MKALFVTHEGFGDSIFRSQVIEHCESMKANGFDFDVLTYETFAKSYGRSLRNLNEYLKRGVLNILLKRAVNIYIPGSFIINLLILARDIRENSESNQYKFIHARADYTAFLCVLLKPLHKLPVVWDCRGDSVDELKYATEKYSSGMRALLYLLLLPKQIIYRRVSSMFSDACVCVSSALRELLRTINPKLSTTVIPCPVPINKFYFSAEQRRKARSAFGVNDDEVLFIYSGSMTGYQAIVEFIWYYKKLLELSKSRLIIATIDMDKARHIFRDVLSDRIIITTVQYDEMNGLYCAADYALMARLPRPLNCVASPTKFGEYCLTGLTVIHNNSIKQVSEFSKILGNGLCLDSLPSVKPSLGLRVEIANKAKNIFGRDFLNLAYFEIYSKLLGKDSLI